MNIYSRRKLLGAAAIGVGGIPLAARLGDKCGLIPPGHAGIYAAGDTLTYAAQRLVAGNSSAREFPRELISNPPFAKGKPPQSEEFKRFEAAKFAGWPLSIEGLVARPASMTIEDVKKHPSSSQITQLTCEEGWSYIAEWVGTPLSLVLNAAGVLPAARYVVYLSMQNNRYDSIDMADALHPQTVLAYGMNGGDLPAGHGGPLRMRVARQLGYKNVKFVTRLIVTDSLKDYQPKGKYSWYAGI